MEVIDIHPVARGWVHWLVADIPPNLLSLDEGASSHLPAPAMELKNGFGRVGWGGPQPPKGSGRHEYRFIVIALDTPGLGLSADAGVEDFRKAVSEHALDSAMMVATYER